MRVAAELLLRAGFNDHEAVADILAPGRLEQGPPPVDRLVVEAHAALRFPQFADAAEGAGIPLLIDPVTFLSQGPLREKDSWLKVPFAGDARESKARIPQLVDGVVSFQLQQRATMIIPPYLYSTTPGDAAWRTNLSLLKETARLLNKDAIDLPVVPVFCAQLQNFATEQGWADGVQPFLARLRELNVMFVALCVSPVGNGEEGVGKLMSLFRLSRRMNSRVPVVAWRQGVYGPALVASGLLGYESGIATREQCDIRRSIGSRARVKDKRSGGPSYGVLFEQFFRSVGQPIVQVLMRDDSMRARLGCLDETCCPDGFTTTLLNRRGHAARTRARQLRLLASQPGRWRLYDVERSAFDGASLAREANKLLEQAGEKGRLKTKGLDSLVEVARALREQQHQPEVA